MLAPIFSSLPALIPSLPIVIVGGLGIVGVGVLSGKLKLSNPFKKFGLFSSGDKGYSNMGNIENTSGILSTLTKGVKFFAVCVAMFVKMSSTFLAAMLNSVPLLVSVALTILSIGFTYVIIPSIKGLKKRSRYAFIGFLALGVFALFSFVFYSSSEKYDKDKADAYLTQNSWIKKIKYNN